MPTDDTSSEFPGASEDQRTLAITDHEKALIISDYEEALADHRRLVRELDGILSGGIENAAAQASLCDLIPFAQQIVAERDGFKDALHVLSFICTCTRPTKVLPDGSIVAPGDHTDRCVLTIARKALQGPQHRNYYKCGGCGNCVDVTVERGKCEECGAHRTSYANPGMKGQT